jgi:hypothetical protein
MLICSHMALKIAVFGIANFAYAAEINFTTCDLCLGNPNAIALGAGITVETCPDQRAPKRNRRLSKRSRMSSTIFT